MPEERVRTAELPGQTVNIDICYIPVAHTAERKLPAVSGSSGHLVVEHVAEDTAASPTWPGKVFADETVTYERAMEQYVAETGDRLLAQREPRAIVVQTPGLWRRRQALQAERYLVREQRKQEDLAWKVAKAQWRQTREQRQTLSKAVFDAAHGAWQQRRRAHAALLQQRQTENHAWHARLAQLLVQEQAQAPKREWIAVLIVTDNCTRQCLGLPAFTSGAHLTSEELISGLREHLPTDLAYLISDQGTHFRAKVFADFAAETGFVHVPVYRHRPQTNGIAERLVRTLKDCLRPATWNSSEALVSLLAAFRDEYNDRPHQGLPIPGLSPNEFANRAWVM